MNGKQATHRIYQRIIDEQMKIFLKQHINESDCTNFIDAFLIERQKRAGTDDFQKIYCDEQFNHLLADVFGAGLDTTLTTLRYWELVLFFGKFIVILPFQVVLIVHGGKQRSPTAGT